MTYQPQRPRIGAIASAVILTGILISPAADALTYSASVTSTGAIATSKVGGGPSTQFFFGRLGLLYWDQRARITSGGTTQNMPGAGAQPKGGTSTNATGTYTMTGGFVVPQPTGSATTTFNATQSGIQLTLTGTTTVSATALPPHTGATVTAAIVDPVAVEFTPQPLEAPESLELSLSFAAGSQVADRVSSSLRLRTLASLEQHDGASGLADFWGADGPGDVNGDTAAHWSITLDEASGQYIASASQDSSVLGPDFLITYQDEGGAPASSAALESMLLASIDENGVFTSDVGFKILLDYTGTDTATRHFAVGYGHSLQATAVPEPGAGLLLLVGLAGLTGRTASLSAHTRTSR